MFSTYVEYILVWIGAVGCMAVDALVARLCINQHGRLVEIAEVTLVESHLTIYLIAGRYAAVGDAPFLKGILAHMNRELMVLSPFPVFLRTYRYKKLSSLVVFQQLMPVVYIEVRKVSVAMECPCLGSIVVTSSSAMEKFKGAIPTGIVTSV